MTDSLSESTGADAVDEITAWVSSKSLAGTSKDSYYNAFRKFASVMLDIDDADDLPERFAALKTSHATNSPTPSASDILRWSDVTPLIEAREEYNYRDPAILAVQWSSGGRPESELWNLTWGTSKIVVTTSFFQFPRIRRPARATSISTLVRRISVVGKSTTRLTMRVGSRTARWFGRRSPRTNRLATRSTGIPSTRRVMP